MNDLKLKVNKATATDFRFTCLQMEFLAARDL